MCCFPFLVDFGQLIAVIVQFFSKARRRSTILSNDGRVFTLMRMTVGPRIPAVWTREPKMWSISFKQFSTNSFFEIIPFEWRDPLEELEGSRSLETSSFEASFVNGISSRDEFGEHEREIEHGGEHAFISGRMYPIPSGESDPLACGMPIIVMPFGMGTIEYPITGTPAVIKLGSAFIGGGLTLDMLMSIICIIGGGAIVGYAMGTI